MQYIHIYLDNAASQSSYQLIQNVKDGISDKHLNNKIRNTQLSKYSKMRSNFIDTANYLTSDTKKEFEKILKQIIESAYTSTHTEEGRLDLESVQALISQKKEELTQLQNVAVQLEEIIAIIEQIRSEKFSQEILKCKLQYEANTGKITGINIPDGMYKEVDQAIINSINQKIQKIAILAKTIQGKIPKAYAKLTSFNSRSKQGDVTIESIFNSFQGYESLQRGLLYELTIYLGYVDQEQEYIENTTQKNPKIKGYMTGNLSKNSSMRIIEDTKYIKNQQLCQKIKQDINAFLKGYKHGQGKADLTFHVYDKHGSFSAVEMVSVKDSVFSALHPDFGHISLGGSAKPFYQLLDNNYLTTLLQGQDPKYYALQTFTGLGGSTLKGIPRPSTKKITGPQANASFKSLVEATGILNFIDYLVGSGKYGDVATYFAVNGKLYHMETVLKKALQNINKISFTIPQSLRRTETKAKKIQTEAFSEKDRDGSDRSDKIKQQFTTLFSATLQAKIKISLLAGLSL